MTRHIVWSPMQKDRPRRRKVRTAVACNCGAPHVPGRPGEVPDNKPYGWTQLGRGRTLRWVSNAGRTVNKSPWLALLALDVDWRSAL